MDKLIFEEIVRIHQLLGTNSPEFLIESILLSEGPIPQAVIRDIERILEPSAKSWIERRLPQSAEPFAKRFEQYIASIPNTKAGKSQIQDIIKNLASLSPKFVDEYAVANKQLYERLSAQVGKTRAEQLIRQRLGDEIFEKINRNSPIITTTKPSNLISVSDFKKWMNKNHNYTFNSNNDYTDDVRNAWNKFGKFYLEATKPPQLLQNVEEVKLFQNWLDKNHADWYKGTTETLNRSEARGYGKYGPKTRDAWEKYSKEYLETLGVKQQLKSIDYAGLDPKTLSWFEKVLSTDKTLSDKIQGTVDKLFQQLLITSQGQQKYIENFYSKFKQALDDNINRIKTGEQADLTTLRNLQQNINQIAATNKSDLDTFYNTLEEVLIEKTGDTGKVKELMDSIKKQDPFKQGTFFGDGRWGWLTEFLNRTSSSKMFQNIGGVIYKKGERGKNFKELLERLSALLLIGAPKSADELYNAFQKQNVLTFKGWPNIPKVVLNNLKDGSLYIQLLAAANLGAPAFKASVNTIKYWFNLFNEGNTEEFEGIWDTWWNKLKEQYEGKEWWKWLNPLHSYLFQDIVPAFSDVSSKAYKGEYKDSINKIAIGNIEKQYDSGQLNPSQFVLAMKGLVDDKDINSIDNTESGFRAFCRAAKLEYRNWSSVNKVGKTEDGTKWVWSPYLKVFLTKEDAKKQTTIQPEPEPVQPEPSPEPSPKPSPSSDDEFIPENTMKNTMKNNLQQRIHSVLKERLNEQKDSTNSFKEKLDVLKTKTQNLLSGLPSWTKNYPCLSDRGQIVKTTSDDVVAFIGKESKQYFYKNMNYLYKGNKDKKGKWSCNNGKLYIEYDGADGKTWTKDTGWVDKPKTKKDEPKKDNTSNKKTKQSKYTKCSEELPIKQWCKNETIRKVQACLKMPKRYQTGNFGPITQEYLESRDQNGTTITTETILNICGSKNPLASGSTGGNATGASATGTAIPYSSGLNAGTPNAGGQKPQSKTGYEDYTVDEIEYSNDTQKTKSSTPSSEKPEGAGTGYEGYSEEKPNQPVSPSTPPATGKPVNLDVSSKKSFYNPQNPDNI